MHLMNQTINSNELLNRVVQIARRAAVAILEVYEHPGVVRSKSDASPVTQADEISERLILNALADLTPDVPVVSEEAAAAGSIPEIGRRFWLVDPLDGTKEFIGKNGEFTVNIALIEERRPMLGVVLAPAKDRLFAGGAGIQPYAEENCRRRPIACRAIPDAGVTVVASRSHGDAAALKSFLGDRVVASFASVGSSLKFCLVAAGEADLYPRLGRTMEWDTAAGHAVLAAAGGHVQQLDGHELIYAKPGFENPHFLALGQTL